MDSVTAGSGVLGMLQMPQVPVKTGSGHRFSDIFAASTLDVAQETRAAMDDLGAMALGLQPTALVQSAPGGGGLPLGVMPGGNTGSNGAPQSTLTDAAFASTFGAGDALPVAAPLSERGGDARLASLSSAQGLPSAQGAESPLQPELPSVSAALKPIGPMDAGTSPVNVARVATPSTEQVVDDVANTDAFNADSLVDAETPGLERQPLVQRVASGVEGGALAAMAPRAVGVVPSDARPTGTRTLSAAVSSVVDAAPEIVTEDADSAIPVDFDTVVDEAISMAPVRQQIRSSVVSAAPEGLNTINAAFDTNARSTAAVDETQLVDALDGAAETAELSIDTPVEDPNWSEALSYRLQFLAQKDGVQSARIQLNPIELGPLEVNIEVVDDVASVQIRADHGVTREALEQAAPRLREMMAGAGFERAELDVAQGNAGEREPSERGLSDRQGHDRTANSPQGSAEDSESARGDGAPGPNRQPGSDPGSGGKLNLYV